MNCHVIGHGGERCIPKEMDSGQAPRGRRRLRHHLDDGEPIPGLYGVGNCVASASAQGYWAGGGTLGPILTFGHLAAEHAARQPVREVATRAAREETTA
jgi:succinate dehydrogenase/fumarate reductase flavoprotein subunit